MRFDVKLHYRLAAVLSTLVVLHVAAADGPTASQLHDARQAAIQRGEKTWRQVAAEDHQPTLTSRWLLGYALTLGEAREYPDRLDRLLAVARRMQDQDPKSKLWGNLRWYWRDDGVTDPNAVEFCMQDALLLKIRHNDWLPEQARKELDELLRLGVEGCLRHRVQADYTNIAILNAGNLIVLGERLRRAEVAAEGYRRLDAVCALTSTLGVREFCSPTYYGTDINGLLLIHSYAKNERQRRQADALLRLFWTDIAANWFPAAERLGGCHSRSYDFLRGLGALDWHLWVQGWLESASPGSAERCEPWNDQWHPPAELAEMARRQLPRLVREHWGVLPAESRTQMVYSDVALSCCGAAYGTQDSTLVVDVPGRDLPRCYFIADGREDPYGKAKIETGAARHPKSLHLQPFWAGAQRSCDAVGLVVYRNRDFTTPEVTRLQSHFVVRRPDAIWIDGKPITIPRGTDAKPAEVPLAGSLVLRYGSAAVGVRVPWSTDSRGRTVAAKLVDDGNSWDCLRVTINHGLPGARSTGFSRNPSGIPPEGGTTIAAANEMVCGAAFWVRVGSNLPRDADFEAWRDGFQGVKLPPVDVSPRRISIEAVGKDGPLRIEAEAPWDATGRVRIVPPPYQGVLEINGREVGRPLLTAVEPLHSFLPDAGPLSRISVAAGKDAYWDAASGLVLPGMTVDADTTAASGRRVGQAATAIGQPSGIVLWTLAIEKPGRYWLWARVRSADANHGKFEVRAIGEDGAVVPPGNWLLRSSGDWQWKPLEIEGRGSPTPLDLPKGLCRISLQARQSDAWIDRLLLTDDPHRRP